MEIHSTSAEMAGQGKWVGIPANSMAASVLGYRNDLVGTGRAIFVLLAQTE